MVSSNVENKIKYYSYLTTYPVYNELTGGNHFKVKRLSCTLSIVMFLGGFGNTAVNEMCGELYSPWLKA